MYTYAFCSTLFQTPVISPWIILEVLFETNFSHWNSFHAGFYIMLINIGNKLSHYSVPELILIQSYDCDVWAICRSNVCNMYLIDNDI